MHSHDSWPQHLHYFCIIENNGAIFLRDDQIANWTSESSKKTSLTDNETFVKCRSLSTVFFHLVEHWLKVTQEKKSGAYWASSPSVSSYASHTDRAALVPTL